MCSYRNFSTAVVHVSQNALVIYLNIVICMEGRRGTGVDTLNLSDIRGIPNCLIIAMFTIADL